MGTQTDIAERIVSGGGDYLLALKANRPVLLQDVAEFFADPKHLTTDADHGRIEERRHVVSYNVDWLFLRAATPTNLAQGNSRPRVLRRITESLCLVMRRGVTRGIPVICAQA